MPALAPMKEPDFVWLGPASYASAGENATKSIHRPDLLVLGRPGPEADRANLNDHDREGDRSLPVSDERRVAGPL